MTKIILETSLGEALDKLSILEIKIEKITDARKTDCQKEYDTLSKYLEPYTKSFPYHYRILKEINKTLWDLEDQFNESEAIDGTKIFPEIKKQNNRRFRLKKKINILGKSELHEQKSYNPKRAFFYGHLGLGDMFWMNGAVRYLSTIYDDVVVVCKKKYEAAVRQMYCDDPSIVLFIIETDGELYPFQKKIPDLEKKGFRVYSCGALANKDEDKCTYYDFPFSFYDDLPLPREYRQHYFFVGENAKSKELLKTVQDISTSYILIHQQSQNDTIDVFTRLKNRQIPILDINKNNYSQTDPFYEVAQLVVNVPMLDYKDLIENAKEIHCLESSFYCFATHLDLSKVEKKVCFLPCDDSAKRLGVFETGAL